ncbi:MAG: sensor histidine kinase [Caldilineaceae bacterium]|nr:sensor histidine kinase [Caldilineaceae bacterium]
MNASWKMRASAWSRRVWQIVGGVSIRVKVLGIVLGVIFILSGFVIVQMRTVLTDKLLGELSAQGVAIGDTIAHEIENMQLLDDEEALSAYLLGRQTHYSSSSHNTLVPYIFVEDGASGRILGGAGAVPDDAAVPGADGALVHQHDDVATRVTPTLIEIVVPVPENDARLHMALARTNIEATVRAVTWQLVAITLVMVAIGFAAAFFLTWILTRPLLSLVAATHDVAQGDLTRRVPHWADDEIGELSDAFNRMVETLERAETARAAQLRLRARYVSGVILAQESERRRIARELHDSTSQSLTSLLVGLQNLKQAVPDDGINPQIDELRHVVGATLEEVRALSWRLRPSALDDLGLEVALQHHIEDFRQRYGIQVDFVVRGLDDRLPPEMETSIYRIVQEGLTNVARYAHAGHASVIISRRHGMIRVIIEDDGVGFDPYTAQANGKSLGLQGIRERAGLFDGSLTIESQPGGGTSLFVEMPYDAATVGVMSADATPDGAPV